MGSQAAGPASAGAPGTRELRAPPQREQLLAAMAAACAAHGYEAVGVDEVAARAGLSVGDFERHFADKEQCALVALNEAIDETTRAVAGVVGPEPNDWERLLFGVLALLELLAARPSAARLAFVEARQAMPEAAYALYASGITVLAAMLDRTRAHAATSAPPSAARAAIGSAEALIRRELLAGRGERLPELLPDVIYGLLVPFLDQQEALRYAALAREISDQGR